MRRLKIRLFSVLMAAAALTVAAVVSPAATVNVPMEPTLAYSGLLEVQAPNSGQTIYTPWESAHSVLFPLARRGSVYPKKFNQAVLSFQIDNNDVPLGGSISSMTLRVTSYFRSLKPNAEIDAYRVDRVAQTAINYPNWQYTDTVGESAWADYSVSNLAHTEDASPLDSKYLDTYEAAGTEEEVVVLDMVQCLNPQVSVDYPKAMPAGTVYVSVLIRIRDEAGGYADANFYGGGFEDADPVLRIVYDAPTPTPTVTNTPAVAPTPTFTPVTPFTATPTPSNTTAPTITPTPSPTISQTPTRTSTLTPTVQAVNTAVGRVWIETGPGGMKGIAGDGVADTLFATDWMSAEDLIARQKLLFSADDVQDSGESVVTSDGFDFGGVILSRSINTLFFPSGNHVGDSGAEFGRVRIADEVVQIGQTSLLENKITLDGLNYWDATAGVLKVLADTTITGDLVNLVGSIITKEVNGDGSVSIGGLISVGLGLLYDESDELAYIQHKGSTEITIGASAVTFADAITMANGKVLTTDTIQAVDADPITINTSGPAQMGNWDDDGIIVGPTLTSPHYHGIGIYNSNDASTGISFQHSGTGSTSGDGYQFLVDSSERVSLINKEATDMRFLTTDIIRVTLEAAGNLNLSYDLEISEGNTIEFEQTGTDEGTITFDNTADMFVFDENDTSTGLNQILLGADTTNGTYFYGDEDASAAGGVFHKTAEIFRWFTTAVYAAKPLLLLTATDYFGFQGEGRIYCDGTNNQIYFADTTPTRRWHVDYDDGRMVMTGPINMGAAGSSLIVTANAITVTKSYHRITNAGSADLQTINGGVEGDELTLVGATAITTNIKDGEGNIQCQADITFDSANDVARFVFDGTNWLLLSPAQVAN